MTQDPPQARQRTSQIGAATFKKREAVPIDQLRPHPRNPRRHPEKGTAEYDTLLKSLEYDYFDPVVWNVRNGQLVSGHLRVKVLKDLGVQFVDVVEVDYDEPTHIARLFAANKGIGEDDKAIGAELFRELREGGFDTDLTGFTTREIDDFSAGFTQAMSGFDFGGDAQSPVSQEQQPSAPLPGENPYANTSAPDTGIRYFQVIFNTQGYEHFRGLMDQVKRQEETALRELYGDNYHDLANLATFVFENYLSMTKPPESNEQPAS